ncbi:MAG TPA: class I SAM-dependent methyltransferase [Candidatus Bathyarchaeia archaeon]|nr:class I SAM-dependent methyltransferase [Candidatus Bathyarchaeia archaeon]
MTTMVSVNKSQRTYLPAAGRDLFLPLYDFVARLLGADKARQSLLDQPELLSAKRVLDIGCGTGTFAVLLKKRFPKVEVIGLDPDQKALARASGKAEKAGVSIRFDRGFADELQYESGGFDVVFSSFMFHHLEAKDREKTLREVRRVLKPSGTFYLLDFEVSDAASGHGLFRLFHSNQRLRDNSEDRILTLVRDARFSESKKIATIPVLFRLGRAGLYQGTTR